MATAQPTTQPPTGRLMKLPRFKKYKNCIVIAGNPGSGKSNALNNIFNLSLEVKLSARGVTKEVEKISVTKNGVDVTVIDTPGMGDKDISQEEVAADIIKKLDGMDYILLYCLSVAPGKRVTDDDKNTVSILHKALGPEALGKCVILFTFSDTVRKRNFKDTNKELEYWSYLQDTATTFTEVLKNVAEDLPEVKVVNEICSPDDIYDITKVDKEITAVPVGKKKTVNADILPGYVKQNEDWTDLVFFQIMKKASEDTRLGFLYLKYGAATVTAAAVGAGIGAVVGAAAGAIGGPLGAAAGSAVGAIVAGGVAGGTTLTISAIKVLIMKIRESSK